MTRPSPNDVGSRVAALGRTAPRSSKMSAKSASSASVDRALLGVGRVVRDRDRLAEAVGDDALAHDAQRLAAQHDSEPSISAVGIARTGPGWSAGWCSRSCAAATGAQHHRVGAVEQQVVRRQDARVAESYRPRPRPSGRMSPYASLSMNRFSCLRTWTPVRSVARRSAGVARRCSPGRVAGRASRQSVSAASVGASTLGCPPS